jgi:hypothetical protein
MRILHESFGEDERAQALAQFLGCDVSEVSCIDRYEFDAPNGESYYVVDEEEAEQLAKEDIENLFDELGLESFTEYFRGWIIENALDKDWFEECVRESTESYVNDIEYEDGRLQDELLAHGVITEEDIESGYDVDDAKERYVELLMEDIDDYVEYCGFNFGWKWVSEVAERENLIDMDVVVEQCIYEDGVAHFIARYDGEEHDLGNGLFAYRNN